MELICVDNKYTDKNKGSCIVEYWPITVGKIYESDNITRQYVYITDDTGHKTSYSSIYFKPRLEHRNNIIKDLLNE
jgi:hypothetical protein